VVALDEVTVEIPQGGFTAVMGPSGSGKSTRMHCMAGLDTVDAGRVLVGDVDLTRLDERRLTRLRRDRVGFVFQAYNLVPTLTALENITLPWTSLAASRTGAGSTPSSARSGSATGSGISRASCPEASSSAPRSRGRWSAGRRSFSPTSRPATSTPGPAPRCCRSCAAR
jgi:ABC-type dipeptide/oligopeptide/nickel transport system ATPase subunit